MAAALTTLLLTGSHNTRKAYGADIVRFGRWGGVLLTTPEMIVRYLHEHATALNTRTLARHLTAIRHWHTYQGFADPTRHAVVKKTLIGIKNVHGYRKNRHHRLLLPT